ncbi:MAG: Gfo/Idh/MocA family oxidoreductase [Armatimonadetes bacterium]|nr:Gfo/Idh/MocA family oxidoreductase [Armatimonadota bacterium]
MAERKLGVGVLGLHEGRTLLVGLSHTIPDSVSHGRLLGPGEVGRAQFCRPVAGCDLRQEKIDACRAVCPDIFYTKDYADMLARPDVDVVVIYTPDSVHAEHIEQAMRAGKHVVCTKPLINSVEGAARIVAAHKETGMQLMVGQSTRFFEPFRRQRAAFEQGDVGQVEFVDAHYTHRMDWYYEKSPWVKETTDWIFLGLSHPIDLVRWYLGEIASVSAVSYRSALAQEHGAKSHDVYSAQFTAKDGRIGRAFGHYGLHELPSARNCIELMLYGDKGTSQAQYHDMRYRHTGPAGEEMTEDCLYAMRGYYFDNEVHGMHYGEFSNYTDAFCRSLIEGSRCSPDMKEGIDVFCLMESARLSAREGRPVNPAEIRALIPDF